MGLEFGMDSGIEDLERDSKRIANAFQEFEAALTQQMESLRRLHQDLLDAITARRLSKEHAIEDLKRQIKFAEMFAWGLSGSNKEIMNYEVETLMAKLREVEMQSW